MPATTVQGRHYATGKRKNAIARIFMSAGKGEIVINGRTLENYFPRETLQMIARQSLEAVNKAEGYDISCTVKGGGISAQAEAIRHGISRALVVVSEDNRPTLKKNGFMTRDDRKKERKKPGQPGARKKFQFSKR